MLILGYTLLILSIESIYYCVMLQRTAIAFHYKTDRRAKSDFCNVAIVSFHEHTNICIALSVSIFPYFFLNKTVLIKNNTYTRP